MLNVLSINQCLHSCRTDKIFAHEKKKSLNRLHRERNFPYESVSRNSDDFFYKFIHTDIRVATIKKLASRKVELLNLRIYIYCCKFDLHNEIYVFLLSHRC